MISTATSWCDLRASPRQTLLSLLKLVFPSLNKNIHSVAVEIGELENSGQDRREGFIVTGVSEPHKQTPLNLLHKVYLLNQ